jgi:hypothetical protein
MLRFGWVLVLVVAAGCIGVVFGCGQSENGSDNDGQAGQSSAAAGTSGAGGTSGGGTSSGAGAANLAGANAAGAGGASGNRNDAAGASGAGTDLVDCDPLKVLCKIAQPDCGAGKVPSVDGSCYGDCVKVERCACSSAAQCPEPDQYTCWGKQHCGPFVQ